MNIWKNVFEFGFGERRSVYVTPGGGAEVASGGGEKVDPEAEKDKVGKEIVDKAKQEKAGVLADVDAAAAKKPGETSDIDQTDAQKTEDAEQERKFDAMYARYTAAQLGEMDPETFEELKVVDYNKLLPDTNFEGSKFDKGEVGSVDLDRFADAIGDGLRDKYEDLYNWWDRLWTGDTKEENFISSAKKAVASTVLMKVNERFAELYPLASQVEGFKDGKYEVKYKISTKNGEISVDFTDMVSHEFIAKHEELSKDKLAKEQAEKDKKDIVKQRLNSVEKSPFLKGIFSSLAALSGRKEEDFIKGVAEQTETGFWAGIAKFVAALTDAEGFNQVGFLNKSEWFQEVKKRVKAYSESEEGVAFANGTAKYAKEIRQTWDGTIKPAKDFLKEMEAEAGLAAMGLGVGVMGAVTAPEGHVIEVNVPAGKALVFPEKIEVSKLGLEGSSAKQVSELVPGVHRLRYLPDGTKLPGGVTAKLIDLNPEKDDKPEDTEEAPAEGSDSSES